MHVSSNVLNLSLPTCELICRPFMLSTSFCSSFPSSFSAFCLCPSLLSCLPQLTFHVELLCTPYFYLPGSLTLSGGNDLSPPIFVGLQFPASTACSEPWFQCHQPSSSPTWEKYIGRFLNLTDKTANYLKMFKETWNTWLSAWGVEFSGLKKHIHYYDFNLESNK